MEAPWIAGTSDAGASTRSPLPDRLLEAATRLFARQGFEGTSVAQIVEAAGVTKGALYHYFDSKDDLLHEIYARVLRMQLQRLEELDSGTAGPAERLHAVACDVIRTSIANIDDTTVFQRSMHLLSPDKQREFRAGRRVYHERFRAIVREGQASGEFRSDVPADLALHYFFGCVHHLDTWYRPDGPVAASDVARHFADLLLAGLRPA
ncbi:TetR/AcrR family transcriptional regulator [Pseudonocardia sp. GCM10023141]|uniref:TetR/AcrR family transcriptional regulator n=1 Tax=Pseudonocardia sp. GCM10023141 TaxID=3252653 RepID=UPI00360ED4C6